MRVKGPNGTFGYYVSASSGPAANANRTTLYSCKGTVSPKPALLTTSPTCEAIYGSEYTVTPIGAVATTKACCTLERLHSHS